MTNKYIFTIVLFCSALFCSSDLNAQCTVHGVDGGNTSFGLVVGEVLGQSFQACQSGEITSITIVNEGNPIFPSPSGTHELRIAAITAPPIAVIGDPVYQTFDTAGGTSDETVTITLNTPFPVTAGNDYAFDITPGGDLSITAQQLPSDEPSGIAYVIFGSFAQFTSHDLDFGVAISAAAGPAAAIPTLSQWGLIILALLLMTAGTLYLVQPNVEEKLGR
ncbi:MAG: IPTL-CTERM sorting domain-containing protein [Chitinophagales bacterium]